MPQIRVILLYTKELNDSMLFKPKHQCGNYSGFWMTSITTLFMEDELPLAQTTQQ